MKLLNATKLAEVTGTHRSYVQAAKRAGYQFTNGRWTTMKSFMDWLAEHPDFRYRDAYPRKGKK